MATFFHGAGPEIQADGLQTLYLMNPSFVGGGAAAAGFSDAGPSPNHSNMVFLNTPLSSFSSIAQPPSASDHQHREHFVGIPIQRSPSDSTRPPPTVELSAIQHGGYNLWTPTPTTVGGGDGLVSFQRSQQGLSLSLSPQQQTATAASSRAGEEARPAPGMQGVLMGSKYLKAAQQLLDEVVSVGKGSKSTAPTPKESDSFSKGAKAATGKDIAGEEKAAADLSTAERQELQMKKAKLVNMLDEVEQRYRQYHHQMQIVVSSFEAVAGVGSAKTYTALALQTISKQFRCLRDAISGQIRAVGKSLGEEDSGGAGGSRSVGSRLRFVDHQLRQQRALQQLGMIQHSAWRPQRGLPERAVSILRAWLFEHFLHPYPKDSDKHMLAKQTGLTRSQVSNWFINARVRLWKPMVEEMYMEETKEQEQQNNNNSDKASKSEASEQSASQQANSSTPPRTELIDNHLNVYAKPATMSVHSSDLARSADESSMQQRLKRARSELEMKPVELSNRELLMKFMDQQQAAAGFGAYPIGEIEQQFAPRFAGNGGVSLTLGLPQQPAYLSGAESMNPLGSEENMNYFSLSNGDGGNNASTSHAPPRYESLNIQSRKRFAAQLLPDFVS